MTLNKDTCLQCYQTRQEVKRNETICATVSGYETVETLDEWDRHHWRDWSNAELKKHGLHPSLWDAHRRTYIYDLESPARESWCMERGHNYPDPNKFTDDPNDLYTLVHKGLENYCLTCYHDKRKEEWEK